MPQPAQHQDRQPGQQSRMQPEPASIRDSYRGSGKLEGRVAIIAGGDSGIGRAVALHYAREGADVVVAYLDEDEDAEETRRLVDAEGRACLALRADLTRPEDCRRVARQAMETHGHIDILVLSVAQQFPQLTLESITPEQLTHTFRNNVFSNFLLVQAVLPHLTDGVGCIIFTGSVTGARGSPRLMDYASTKGAIHTLNYSLAQSLAGRGIRVNLVAPGPVWTPLIPSSFSAEEVEKFGSNTLMKRAGQPCEVGPAYVFLAAEDATFITGQVIHVNGGGFIGD